MMLCASDSFLFAEDNMFLYNVLTQPSVTCLKSLIENINLWNLLKVDHKDTRTMSII